MFIPAGSDFFPSRIPDPHQGDSKEWELRAESNQVSRPTEQQPEQRRRSRAHPGPRCFLRGPKGAMEDSSTSKQVSNWSIFTKKLVSKLLEIWSGMVIPDPDLDFYPFRIPDPGVHRIQRQKAPDPGSGSSTLLYKVKKVGNPPGSGGWWRGQSLGALFPPCPCSGTSSWRRSRLDGWPCPSTLAAYSPAWVPALAGLSR